MNTEINTSINFQGNNQATYRYHTNEQDITKVSNYGKDYTDAYTNHPESCLDYYETSITKNISKLKTNLAKVKFQLMLRGIGIAIGFFLGFYVGITEKSISASITYGLILACVGGTFLGAVKSFASIVGQGAIIAAKGRYGAITIVSIFFHIIILLVKCIFSTLKNTIVYITYFQKTKSLLDLNEYELIIINEYKKYTAVKEQFPNEDLESLVKIKPNLSNNLYYKILKIQGETGAAEHIQNVAKIIEDSEKIINDFPKSITI